VLRIKQRNRRAGGAAFVHAAQDLDLVGLSPLRGMARFTGGATFQVSTEVFRRDRDARRAPSITQPIAGPWLSPKVVTRSRRPKVLSLIRARPPAP
jgi:hypothetical protein